MQFIVYKGTSSLTLVDTIHNRLIEFPEWFLNELIEYDSVTLATLQAKISLILAETHLEHVKMKGSVKK